MISKFKPFHGPHQYVFKDPDTGFAFKEKSKKTLIDRIVIYRQQNNLPELQFLDDVLENYWCGLPENVGRCEPKALKLGLLPLMKAGIVLIKNYMYDRFATQDVAEKRASQCVGCKFNKKPDTEGVKYWLDLVVINTVKGHRVPDYEKLGTCEACNCPINSKVFYDGTISPSREEKEKFTEVNCWQLGIIKT